ncbi:MAG: flagellar biosynthesis protein [Sphingobium sp.]
MLSSEVNDAQAVSIGSLAGNPSRSGFKARFADGQEIQGYRPAHEDRPDHPLDPMDQARADAFAQGFDEGVRVATESLSADANARERMVYALEQIAPASNGALATMLSTAVIRLVSQIVGEASVDGDLLRQRCETIAAFVEDGQGKNNLHIHPDDAPLLEGCALGVPLVRDASMARGNIRLDTADGWIEDGPDIQLSRLRGILDDMEGKS